MAVDIIIVASVLTTVIAGLGAFIARLHIKHCSAGCINSDCMTPPNSPSASINENDTKATPRGLSKLFRLAKRINELEVEAIKEEQEVKETKSETTI